MPSRWHVRHSKATTLDQISAASDPFFQARECPDDDWWLGRAVAVIDAGFGGKCFRQFAKSETLDFVQFDKSDFAIAVQWYERIPNDPARLEFAMVDPGVCVMNATELRHWLAHRDVEQVLGPAPAVVRPARGKSGETEVARAARAEVIDAGNEPKRTYRVQLDVEQLVLDRCW
jgi:hypothetical protein